MKSFRTAAVIAAIIALPSAGFAQSAAPPAKTKQSAAAPAKTTTSKVVTTTMTGVVQKVEDNSLVISRNTAKGPEETFQLNTSTTRHGKLAVGDVVSVRYVLDNGQKVAKVVTVKQAPKPKHGKA